MFQAPSGAAMELDVCMPVISQYLKPGATPEEKASVIQQLTQLIQSGTTSILNVVASLQDWLISEDADRRAQGTRMLAGVLQQASSHLTPNDLHHLLAFMSARLSDWPCTEAAADGCLATLEAGTSGAGPSKLTEADAVSVVRVCMDEVSGHVQQLVQKDRAVLLKLLLRSTQLWGVPAAKAGVNLVEGCIAAVDGEKDPRCLLLSFQLIQAVAQVYHSRDADAQPWIAAVEEVVEVLSCYFPLAFHPPKTDPHKITRQQLAGALMDTLSCSPFMAQWVLPLVLEKLSSTYRPAKEDALAALTACFQRYGPEALSTHLPAVWSALRSEVMGPSSFGLTGGEELSTARVLAEQAAGCLQQCCRAPGGSHLVTLVIQDDKVTGDLMSCVQQARDQGVLPTREGGDPHRGDRQLLCAAMTLGAVCASTPAAAEQVCSTVLVRLLAALPPQTGSTPAQWASPKTLYCLTAAQQLLHQVVAATDKASSSNSSSTVDELLLKVQPHAVQVFQAMTTALEVLTPVLSDDTNDMQQDTPDVDREGARQVLLTCCSTIASLLTLHQCYPPTQPLLSSEALATALTPLSTCSLADSSADEGGSSWLSDSAVHHMSWRVPCTVADTALTVLIQAATVLGGAPAASGEPVLRQLAVHSVSQLVGSSGGDVVAPRAVHVCERLAQAAPLMSGLLLMELAGRVQAACSRLMSSEGVSTSALETLLKLLRSCLSGAGNPPTPAAVSSCALQLIHSLLAGLAPPQGSDQHITSQLDDAVMCSLALTAGQLTSCCSDTQQSELSGSVIKAASSNTLGGPASVLCYSVLAAVKPASLPQDQVQPLVDHLLQCNQTSCNISNTSEHSTQLRQLAGGVVLGSLLNKVSQVGSEPSDAAAVRVLQGLQVLPGGAAIGVDLNWRLAAVPWVVAALARRGSSVARSATQEVISQLLPGAHHLTAVGDGSAGRGDALMQDADAQPSEAAALVHNPVLLHRTLLAAIMFQVMFSHGQHSGSHMGHVSQARSWFTWHHVINKLLWQQHMVNTCLTQLLELLQQPAHRQHQPLHVALAVCVTSAPSHLLATYRPTIIQVLPDCLAALLTLNAALTGLSPHDVNDMHMELRDAVQHGLRGLQQLLVTCLSQPSTAQLLEPHVQDLLPLICDTCTSKGSPEVREAGITLLASSQQALPYHLLHPHKTKVLGVISRALDDNKRSVRVAAVQCRRLWSVK